MAAYDRCESCKGNGYFRCDECACKPCQSSGKVNCRSCDKGKAQCPSCGGNGEISKKGWILTHSEVCPECRGPGRITCSACNGSTKLGNYILDIPSCSC
jgi:DnaJ-class molecular chaperone